MLDSLAIECVKINSDVYSEDLKRPSIRLVCVVTIASAHQHLVEYAETALSHFLLHPFY